MTAAPQSIARDSTVTGWVEAALYTLAIGLLSVAYAVANQQGAHIVVFILYSLLVSALALIAITGFGSDARAVMLARETWIVGISNIVVEGAYAILLGFVAPADGSLMLRWSIPLALVIGAVFMHRYPSLTTWAGGLLVGAVVVWLMTGIEPTIVMPVAACAAACAIAINVRGFASEFHKQNRAATTIMQKMQVTGVVTLVTVVTSIVLVALLMTAVSAGLLSATPLLPAPAALLHVPTIILALLVGGAIFTAMTYLSFSSVLKIRTENFIATSAFMPLATFLVQWPAANLGWITLPPFEWRLLPAMLLAIVGVLIMVWGRRKAG